MNDALGNPIVLGASYGTNVSYEGHFSIVLGIAENITPKGNVTLHITKRSKYIRGVWTDVTADKWENSKRTLSTVTHSVFPIPEQEVK